MSKRKNFLKSIVLFEWILIVLFTWPASGYGQIGDALAPAKPDTGRIVAIDSTLISADSTAKANVKSYHSVVNNLLLTNKYINIKDAPVYLIIEKKQFEGKEFVFYILFTVVLILALFKTFYQAYFNNVFRVFFNTSLRQSQLTDQLLQAKLPSFILNIFFTICAGIFLWLLFTYYRPPQQINRQLLLVVCILGVGILYFVKYCILKFVGWVSTMQDTVDSYIFIIFLVNKISGIVLVPFLVILAFSLPMWVHYITTVAVFVIALFFLSRYIKTYGALENKVPLNAFHFLVYVMAMEIIPILILYKVTIDYLI
ncbi:MAG: DUF4271 domain-containing protein [Ginsengibacter sp.]